jgi:hypothetical protein
MLRRGALQLKQLPAQSACLPAGSSKKRSLSYQVDSAWVLPSGMSSWAGQSIIASCGQIGIIE